MVSGQFDVSDASSQTGRSHTLQMLVAVADPISEKIMARLLENMGHSPDVVLTSEPLHTAFKTATSVAYDLVLVERKLLASSNADIIHQIRHTLPPHQQPFIALLLSEDTLSNDCAEYKAQGIDLCIEKPIQRQDVQQAISKAAARKETLQNLDPIDLSYLRDIIGSNTTLLYEFISDFRTHSYELMCHLKQSVADRDAVHIEHYAHTLKGSCANMGAKHLVYLLYQLEKAGTNRRAGRATEQLHAVEQEYQRVCAALEQARY